MIHRNVSGPFRAENVGPIVPTYGEACVSALEGSPS